MGFRVNITAKAKRDLNGILVWLLSHEAGDTGSRWFDGLRETIASLGNFPERCPLAPESHSFPYEVRQLFYGHRQHRYRILFTVEAGVVYVLHIRHGRRGPASPN